MRPDKEHLRLAQLAAGMAENGPDIPTLVKAGIATLAEGIAFVVHYSAYAQTMNAWLFRAAPEMHVNHLIAGLMAIASVGAPVFAFIYLMRENIIDEPQAHFRYIPNRVYFGLIAAFWALMVGVEILNVLTLIDTYVQNPFQRGQVAAALRSHSGLAFLSAVVISIVNSALALVTARVWFSILGRKEE
jgi:hypothetical protein